MNRAILPSCALLVALLGSAAWAGSSDRPREAITPGELGRLLFWDPILSGPMDVSCGTCHHPDFAYADGRTLSLGTGSEGLGPTRVDRSGGAIAVVPRNAPTILNVALNGLDDRRGEGPGGRRDEFGQIADALPEVNPARAPMFWDSRIRSLEAQALEPLKVREEMRGDAYPAEVAVDSVVARLRAIPEYVSLFREAFGTTEDITADRVAQAISAFERSLVAVNSPFDRYQAGDPTALTEQQRWGLEAFDDVGCTDCHDGPMLSDFDRHAEGVAENPLLAAPDAGDGRFRFRTPTLRNVALTAPYMHNGMLATLADVLRFYDEGESANPNVANRGRRRGNGNGAPPTEVAAGGVGGTDAVASTAVAAPAPPGVLDGDFRGVDNMSDREMADIVAFLEALTDPTFDRMIPETVPSRLPVGGRMIR